MLQVNIVPINDLPTTNYSKQNRETGGKQKGWRALCEKEREDVPLFESPEFDDPLQYLPRLNYILKHAQHYHVVYTKTKIQIEKVSCSVNWSLLPVK